MILLKEMHNFDAFFRRVFGGLGRWVGRRPVLALVLPVAATVALATLLDDFRHERDPEFLFSPVQGDGRCTKRYSFLVAHCRVLKGRKGGDRAQFPRQLLRLRPRPRVRAG